MDAGEAWGISEAIRWCKHLGLADVEMDTNYIRVVGAMTTDRVADSVFEDYIALGGSCFKIYQFIESLGRVEMPII